MTTSMPRSARKRYGSSLVTVLLIGSTAALMVAAVMCSVIPTYNQVARGRINNVLRSAAEAALDWTVAQLNDVPGTVDDTTEDGIPNAPIQVPRNEAGTYGIPAESTVTINNIQPPQSSYLYDPRLDPANAATNGGITGNGWRMVTANSVSGRQTKTVRVILKPNYAQSPALTNALFANRTLALGGNGMTVDSYDSSLGPYGGTNRSDLGADVGSNGAINIGNSNIGGNLYVYSSPINDSSTTVADCGPNAVISGGVLCNALASDRIDTVTQGRGLPAGTPAVQESLALRPMSLPPVPSHPTTAVYIPTIGGTSRAGMTLAAGDYWCNSINIGGSSSVQLPRTGTVRIFVEGANPSINIGGEGFDNQGRPVDLQIFTSATEIRFSGNASFTGVIYAPNAQVSLTGNAQYFGAVIGNEISLQGGGSRGGFHYDRSLATANILDNVSVARLQTVSWQEL